MSIPLSPVTLIPNKMARIPITVAPQNLQAVRISNESPYALQILGPDSASQYWLPAWMEDVIISSGGAGIAVTPFIISTIPSLILSNVVLITLYYADEPLPTGTWPCQLVREVNLGVFTAPQPNSVVEAVSVLANTAAAVPITPAASQTAYISGFDWTVKFTNTITHGEITVTGTTSANPLVEHMTSPANQGGKLIIRYPFAVQGSALGQAINVSTLCNQVCDQDLIVYGFIV